jgi:hypothetical protein
MHDMISMFTMTLHFCPAFTPAFTQRIHPENEGK